MKERTPESVTDPDNDYASRYGTQSFDDLPQADAPANTGSVGKSSSAPDPYDGFEDYVKRHVPGARIRRRWHDGFDRYTARYFGRRKAADEPLTVRDHVAAGVFFALTIAVFLGAFSVIRPYVLAQFPGELGMGGLFVLGLIFVGAAFATGILMAIVAVIFGMK